MFDILITGAKVIDGSGGPWFEADVAIKDGKIEAIGSLEGAKAAEVIDGGGLAVSPGFIDIHSHSDSNLLINPKAESKIRQGVTTEVIGQCGNSAAPIDPARIEDMKKMLVGDLDIGDLSWSSMAEYLSLLETRGIAVNCAALAGHGNIRRLAMGEGDNQPDSAELEEMRRLLRESLEAGAFGMSSGLIYPPGVYCETPELIELAKVLAEYDGIYFTHIRNEADRLEDSLNEAIEIGTSGGCRVQISHLKVVREPNWGKGGCALEILEQARRDGLEITADQYPYIATSTGLTASLPAWAHDGGRKAMLERLNDADQRQAMKDDMPDAGWDLLVVSRAASEKNQKYEGMNIEEIAADRGVDPREAVFQLLVEEKGNVGTVRFGLSEDDVGVIMSSPLVMGGSDGSALAPTGPLGRGKPHPRSYGTFPRILGKYSREEGLFPIEEAVAKMTSRPAAKLHLWDRGLLRPGFWADVVLFDPETVRDVATFTDPHRFPRGIEYVLVNGEVVIDGETQRSVTPGRVLRRG